jgi:hypothetical protein
LANGLPYLVGTERLKGSHSMSGYHSIELCYLAAVYTNLLIRHQPLELHFKPKAKSFPDGVLRVAPDLLPAGRVRLSAVWVDDQPYTDFDAEAMTVRLPANKEVRVRARLVSTSADLDLNYERVDGDFRLTLTGACPDNQVGALRADLNRALAAGADRVVLIVNALQSLSEEAVNELLFFRSKVPIDCDVVIVGANDSVKRLIEDADSPGAAEFVFADSL